MRLVISFLRIVTAGRFGRREPSNESKRLAGVLQPVRRNR